MRSVGCNTEPADNAAELPELRAEVARLRGVVGVQSDELARLRADLEKAQRRLLSLNLVAVATGTATRPAVPAGSPSRVHGAPSQLTF